MNTKYIILAVLFLIIVALAWSLNQSANNSTNMNGMQMGGSSKAGTHMMKMPDGTMMEMNNADMGR